MQIDIRFNIKIQSPYQKLIDGLLTIAVSSYIKKKESTYLTSYVSSSY